MLVGLAGAFSWLGTPGLGQQAWLAGIALVPVLLVGRGCRPPGAFAWTGLAAGAHYAAGKWQTFANAAAAHPELGLPACVLVLLFFASLALPYAVFATARSSHPAADRLLSGPWAAGFSLAALILICPTLFPYTPVVLISHEASLIQLADLGGEPLLLGLLLTVNSGVAEWLRPRHGEARRWRSAAGAIVLPIALALGYGAWSDRQHEPAGGASLSALSLQSHWPSRSGDQILLRDARNRPPRSAVELSRAGLNAAPHCELLLWPETPRSADSSDRTCATAGRLAAELQRPIAASCHAESDGRRIFPARLYNAAGALVAEHRKSRLIPAYETPLFGSDQQALQPGEGPTLFRSPILPALSPSLCFEVHFATDLRKAARSGAQAFLHMANFSLFRSELISQWDLAMSRLRAVENRRAILRSVNAGVAGLILPDGRWHSTLPPEAHGAQCLQVPLRQDLSPYTRWGDRLFWGLLLALLAVTGLAQRRRHLNPAPGAQSAPIQAD